MKDVVKSQQSKDDIKIINGQPVRVSQRKRRNNMKGIYAIIVLGVVIFMMILSMTVFFNVTQVEIIGVSLYTNDQILVVGGIDKGANLLRMDTTTVENRLINYLPYVESATVTTKFPNGLKIEITEAEPSASIENDGAYYVVSGKGVVLDCDKLLPAENVPVVEGFECKDMKGGSELASEDNLKAGILEEILAQLVQLDFENIGKIDMTDRTDIVMTYDDRIDIYLGSSYDMSYKLTEIKAVIDKGLTDTFKGELKYNGADSGISAIPQDSVSTPATTTTVSDTSPSDDGQTTTTAADNAIATTTTAPQQ